MSACNNAIVISDDTTTGVGGHAGQGGSSGTGGENSIVCLNPLNTYQESDDCTGFVHGYAGAGDTPNGAIMGRFGPFDAAYVVKTYTVWLYEDPPFFNFVDEIDVGIQFGSKAKPSANATVSVFHFGPLSIKSEVVGHTKRYDITLLDPIILKPGDYFFIGVMTRNASIAVVGCEPGCESARQLKFRPEGCLAGPVKSEWVTLEESACAGVNDSFHGSVKMSLGAELIAP